MTTRIAFPGLLMTVLCGCAKTAGVAPQSETAELHPIQTVCSVLEPDAHFSDRHITVRGQFVGLVETSLLKDSACDSKTLFLHYVPGGPHFLFCESEQLSLEFGCPGGRNGPIVTVTGVLSKVDALKGSERGIFAIEEVVAYESTRTGKIVSP